ncbi:MAG: DUF2207 domain-containing protein [Imperialibacter sp.]|uniref:DUF2207 domain-containing protein n=1 Tax=Imperialibacter sp. TaxID=2038411 RepID=UPI003A87C782
MKNLVVFFCASVISLALAAQESPIFANQERVISYESDITINVDASIDVVETIRVYAKGNDIRRGIYRAYPTEYTDKDGFSVSIDFEVMEVLKDGVREPYHTERDRNGEVVYIGQENVFLEPGEYTYTIKYGSAKQLGFFDDYDELYYNINGTGWIFPIEKVTATIHLPEGADIVQYNGYTGTEGADGKDFEVTEEGNQITFTTTRPFQAYENLTIAVAWPKGIVTEPARPLKAFYLWMEEWSTTISGCVLLLLLLYWFRAWRKVGIDPPKGAIIPLFDPPKHFSPADCYFVYHEQYGQKALAADIVDMGVKGLLTIDYSGKKFTLKKTMNPDLKSVSEAQRKLFDKLFSSYRTEVVLEQANHSAIGSAVSAHEKALRKELDGIYFKMNRSYMFMAFLITIVGMLALVPWGKYETGFLIFILPILNLPIIGLVAGTISSLMTYFERKYGLGVFIALLIFTLPLLGGYMYLVYASLMDLSVVAIVFGFILANGMFIYLIKAPTVEGRKVMDQLEGLRLFMKTAEEDRFNRLQSKGSALEFFEKLLPFSIALGVENEWGEHFESYLKATSNDGMDYHPIWYHNASMRHFSSSTFSSSISSSLTSNISSSSTAPGSSSGSGGGGSSGGGGGGGGGGGW